MIIVRIMGADILQIKRDIEERIFDEYNESQFIYPQGKGVLFVSLCSILKFKGEAIETEERNNC
ncbi:hypothetical protein ACFSQ7_21370 [Paenibacillus rhizoplanae]